MKGEKVVDARFGAVNWGIGKSYSLQGEGILFTQQSQGEGESTVGRDCTINHGEVILWFALGEITLLSLSTFERGYFASQNTKGQLGAIH